MQRFSVFPAVIGLALLVSACAQPGPAASGSGGTDQASTGPKRFTAAIRGNPHTVYQKLNPRSNIPGIDALEQLATAGLTVPSLTGSGRAARIAEAAPTIENGLWKLFPDGRMDVTWTIKEGAVWHDGTPFTADDLVFTAQVVRDKRLPVLGSVAFESLGTVEALNARTVVSHWTQTFITADGLFGTTAVPIPKHLLEEPYRNLSDQEQFVSNPYWSTGFVGMGPYKIKQWEAGSFMVFEANDRYIMGRPKIDEITVKFIPDPNTLGANMLAGEVDMNWGNRVDLEWAMNVADQWRAGKLMTAFASMIRIYAQHMDSSPSLIATSVDFKKSMVHALDRQTMADVLQFGLTSVAHSLPSPNEPEYPFVDSAVVKYEYDPRRSLQLLEGLGFVKGADGALRDQTGKQLAFQIRTSLGDVTQEKAMYATADDWQRLGVDVERHLVVPQRASDAEYRATFPGFDVKRQGATMSAITTGHSRGIALPQNNYLASGNNSRYTRPDMDALIDKYFTTVPWEQRMDLGRQIIHRLSDEVAWIGLYHLIAPSLIPNRVPNMPATDKEASMLDFIHEWDVRN